MGQKAGWYPDVDDRSRERYWDGQQWTTRMRSRRGATRALVIVSVLTGVIVLGLLVGLAVRVGNALAKSGSETSADRESSAETREEATTADPPEVAPPTTSQSQRQDEAAEADGWSVIESGSLYGRFADTNDYTCGYTKCSYYLVHTLVGCPSGLYVEATVLSNGVVVGMANDLLPGVQAGETAAAHLLITEDRSDSLRISEVNCY